MVARRGIDVLIMSVEQLARVLVDVERAMQIGVKRWRLRMARQFACDLVRMRRRYGWRRYFMPSWHSAVRNYRMFRGEVMNLGYKEWAVRFAEKMGVDQSTIDAFMGRNPTEMDAFRLERYAKSLWMPDVIAAQPAQPDTPRTEQDAPQPPQ